MAGRSGVWNVLGWLRSGTLGLLEVRTLIRQVYLASWDSASSFRTEYGRQRHSRITSDIPTHGLVEDIVHAFLHKRTILLVLLENLHLHGLCCYHSVDTMLKTNSSRDAVNSYVTAISKPHVVAIETP